MNEEQLEASGISLELKLCKSRIGLCLFSVVSYQNKYCKYNFYYKLLRFTTGQYFSPYKPYINGNQVKKELWLPGQISYILHYKRLHFNNLVNLITCRQFSPTGKCPQY